MFPRSLAILLVAFATSSPAAVIIDDFSAGAVTLRREVGQPWIFRELQNGLPTASVIGGSRLFSLAARDYFHTGAAGGVTLDIDTASGELDYTNDPGITAVNFEIRYGSIEQPLTANLAMGGNDRLRFGFKWAEFEPIGDQYAFFDVRVQTKHDTLDTSGGGASAIISTEATPFVVDVLFKDMQRGAPYALDFSRVVSISFGSSNGYLPGDFVLDYVIVVPEPTTNAVLGIGAILVGISRRRGGLCMLRVPLAPPVLLFFDATDDVRLRSD
jgi:hypothetical protein